MLRIFEIDRFFSWNSLEVSRTGRTGGFDRKWTFLLTSYDVPNNESFIDIGTRWKCNQITFIRWEFNVIYATMSKTKRMRSKSKFSLNRRKSQFWKRTQTILRKQRFLIMKNEIEIDCSSFLVSSWFSKKHFSHRKTWRNSFSPHKAMPCSWNDAK